MSDLDERGLLDETLVAVVSDFGRTPHINKDAGRDHWTYCYTVLLAGAGIKGGAAAVRDNPVSTGDVCATIYHCLGIDPDTLVHDHGGRPLPIANGGQPIRDILV
jgi:arylsulfatase A-like enzyme